MAAPLVEDHQIRLFDLSAETEESLLLASLQEQRDQLADTEEPHLPSLSAGRQAQGDRQMRPRNSGTDTRGGLGVGRGLP